MSTTAAQLAAMQRAAARFEQASDSLAGLLTRLMGELEPLQAHWQGAGGRSFAQAKQEWAEQQQALQRLLLQTAEAIRAAGNDYVIADAGVADRVARVGRDVILPL